MESLNNKKSNGIVVDNCHDSSLNKVHNNMRLKEPFSFSIDDCFLYLNIVGGHSLFIQIPPNFLIKSTCENEILFYKTSQSFVSSDVQHNYFPKFIGTISKNTQKFEIIENYVSQCKIFFKNFLIKNNYKASELNIEGDKNFLESFQNFIREPDNQGGREKKSKEVYNKIFHDECSKNPEIQLNNSFKLLEKNLNAIPKNKLRWILFWFIKWKDNFLTNDYLILENLVYDMHNPAILDVKIGSSPRISKENKIKKFSGAINEIGCRIMGCQKNFLFKNRYDTRDYTVEQFKEEIFNFFKIEKENKIDVSLVSKVVREIGNVEQIIKVNQNFLMKFSSLLIAYDYGRENKLKINLIDFSYYEENPNVDKYNLIKNDFIQSLRNFATILKKGIGIKGD